MKNLSPIELRTYPGELYRAILNLAARKKAEGLPAELDKLARASLPAGHADANDPQISIHVPLNALFAARAMSAGTASAGGTFVDDSQGEIQHLLRPYSAVVASGAQIIPNNIGNLSIGRESAGTTFSSLPEGGTITESTPTAAATNFSPKRHAGACSMSSQLNAQTAGVYAAFQLNSIARGLGSLQDRIALQGIGGVEPLSIFGTNGTGSVTFGAAATWAKALAFFETASTANADDQSLAAISHPAVRTKWRTLQKWSGASVSIWEADRDEIAGRPARVTTNCPATSIVVGDWTQYAIATWGADTIRLIVDPFSLAMSGRIRFTAEMLADCGPLQPAAFCVSNDSAVQ